MKIALRPLTAEERPQVVQMITEFYNLHRQLTNSPGRFQQTDEGSEEGVLEWMGKGNEVLTIWRDDQLAGFLAVGYGGTTLRS